MKKVLSIILILTMVLSLSACKRETPEKNPDAFVLELVNGCDDKIYGFHVEYSLGEESVSGGGGVNADGSPVKKGESFYFDVLKEGFPNIDAISDLTAQIYVITDEVGAEKPVGEEVKLNAKFGETSSITVKGSISDGFTVETLKAE